MKECAYSAFKKIAGFKRAVLLLVLMLAGVASVWANDFKVDGVYYDIISDTEVEVTSDRAIQRHTSLSGKLTIPETVTYDGTTYSVTGIGNYSFYYYSELTEVIIPESVTYIGDYAFGLCTSLTSITIPNSVTSIEEYAFASCIAAESVTIGSGVTSIATYAFFRCISLTEIYLLNPTPPTVSSSETFNKVDKENCVLYVPVGSYDAYATADYWSEFLNIVEVDFGGIDEIAIDKADATETARYDLSGRQLLSPQPGVNIVRYSDGTVEKVIVK